MQQLLHHCNVEKVILVYTLIGRLHDLIKPKVRLDVGNQSIGGNEYSSQEFFAKQDSVQR